MQGMSKFNADPLPAQPCVTRYFWLFTKSQATGSAFLLPPDNENVAMFETAMIFGLTGKLIHILVTIWNQRSIVIFFIDWESGKSELEDSNAESDQAAREKAKNAKTMLTESANQVSAWRRLFIANEWNELQSMQSVSIRVVLLFTVICWQEKQVQDWSNQNPTGGRLLFCPRDVCSGCVLLLLLHRADLPYHTVPAC